MSSTNSFNQYFNSSSNSNKLNNSNSLKPIEDILNSISSNRSVTEVNNSTDSIMSGLASKIILLLFILLFIMIAKIYFSDEIKKYIEKIKNYFETIKYHKKEEKELSEQKHEEKKIAKEEKQNAPKTTQDIIHASQQTINDNKKEYKADNFPTGIQTSSLSGSVYEHDQELEKKEKDALQKALDDAAKNPIEIEPDAVSSSIQSKTKGWCLIGNEKGSRTCAEIGPRDVCMSGEIYPTMSVCINPKLRA